MLYLRRSNGKIPVCELDWIPAFSATMWHNRRNTCGEQKANKLCSRNDEMEKDHEIRLIDDGRVGGVV
jgi:hypothetical protein